MPFYQAASLLVSADTMQTKVIVDEGSGKEEGEMKERKMTKRKKEKKNTAKIHRDKKNKSQK